MNVAHLSDLHIGRHVSPAQERALAEDLLSRNLDMVVVSGDITDRGSRWQFRKAQEFLRSLGVPCIVVPGNREISATAVWEWLVPPLAMSRFRSFFGASDRVVFIAHEHKAVFFGVNTVHKLPSWPGKIVRQTRYWLRETAAGFPGYFKVLALHHPVLPVIRGSSFWAHQLSDAGEVLNICTLTGISLILQGHKHRSAIVEVGVPERQASVVVSCGGAPLTPDLDSTYHFIRVSDGSLHIEPRDFKDGRFQRNSGYSFRLNGGRIVR
ncbi:MAG: metallophosphoesterase [Desulfomonile sp.]|nr:metallophosphoesterase [Desulfomonile sp.]